MQIDSVMYKKNYYKSASLIFDKKLPLALFCNCFLQCGLLR